MARRNHRVKSPRSYSVMPADWNSADHRQSLHRLGPVTTVPPARHTPAVQVCWVPTASTARSTDPAAASSADVSTCSAARPGCLPSAFGDRVGGDDSRSLCCGVHKEQPDRAAPDDQHGPARADLLSPDHRDGVASGSARMQDDRRSHRRPGRHRRRPSGTATRSANTPGRLSPISTRCSHRLRSPRRQAPQAPQPINGKMAARAPPGVRATASWPSTSGGVRALASPR